MIAGRDLAGWLKRADELGSEGRYFEAHEELEVAWKAADGGTRILLQGLIQLAAGLHRLATEPGKADGARYLLERGLLKLQAERSRLAEESLTELTARIEEIGARGEAPDSFRFGLRPFGSR